MDTTVVNPQGGGSSVGMIVGLVLAAGIIVAGVIFGIPFLRSQLSQSQQPTSINVTLPNPIPTPTPEQPAGN